MGREQVWCGDLAAQLGVPAQVGADPGDDLQGVEGFGDVVVRAHVQPQDFVRVLTLGGEEDDGHVAQLPQLRGGGDAVHAGHHDVHEHQVELVLLEEVDGLLTGVGAGDAVAFAGEVYFQSGYDVVIVVANENLIHEKAPFLVPFYHSTEQFRKGR